MRVFSKRTIFFCTLFCTVLINQIVAIHADASLDGLPSRLSILKNRLVDLSAALSSISSSHISVAPNPGAHVLPTKASIIANIIIANKIAGKLPDTPTPKKLHEPDVKTSYVKKVGELEGKKVVLKPYSESMFPEYVKNFTQIASQGYKLFPWGIPAQKAQQVLWRHLAHRRAYTLNKKFFFIHYCIFDKESGQLVGEIEVRRNMPPGDMGIWLNENFWGKGIMKEAVHLIAREYFRVYPSISSFSSAAASWNINSIKGHLNAGFKPSGFSHDAVSNLKSFIEANKLNPYYSQSTIAHAIKFGALKGLPPSTCFFQFTKDTLPKLEGS